MNLAFLKKEEYTEEFPCISLRCSLSSIPPKAFSVSLFDSLCQESHRRPSLYLFAILFVRNLPPRHTLYLTSILFVRHRPEDLSCISLRYSFVRHPPECLPVSLFDTLCQASHRRHSLYFSSIVFVPPKSFAVSLIDIVFVGSPTEDLPCISLRDVLSGIPPNRRP
jgi:hypothetical protein